MIVRYRKRFIDLKKLILTNIIIPLRKLFVVVNDLLSLLNEHFQS